MQRLVSSTGHLPGSSRAHVSNQRRSLPADSSRLPPMHPGCQQAFTRMYGPGTPESRPAVNLACSFDTCPFATTSRRATRWGCFRSRFVREAHVGIHARGHRRFGCVFAVPRDRPSFVRGRFAGLRAFPPVPALRALVVPERFRAAPLWLDRLLVFLRRRLCVLVDELFERARPLPLFLPPPLPLFTVAHARRAASSSETPRFS